MLKKIKYHLVYAIITLIGSTAIVIFHFQLLESSRSVLQQEDRDKAYRIAMELEYTYFDNVSNTLLSMTELNQLKDALLKEDNVLLQDLLKVLKYSYPHSVVYIMDRKGTVVEGTPYDKDGSTFIGKNYSFRSYFYQTKYGNSVIYPATGVTSGIRGLYFSRGIFRDGEFLGTLVVKMGMKGVDTFLSYEQGLHLAVMSPEGVIFSSSEESFLYGYLSPVSEYAMKKIRDNQQFGGNWLKALGELSGDDSIDINGSENYYGTVDFHKTEWKLLYIKPISQYVMRAEDRALMRIIIFSFIPLMVILFFLVRILLQKQESESSLRLYHFMVEQSPISIVMTDLKGEIEYTNPYFCKHTGYDCSSLIGERPSLLNSGMHDRHFYKDLWNTVLNGKPWSGEICNKKKDGEFFWENARIYPLKDKKGDIYKLIGVKTDITSQKEMINRLEYYASVDEMTSVMNRRTGMLVLEKEIQLCMTSGHVFCLCYADINGLKNVNDTLGHSEGDKLIQAGSEILREVLRSSDSVCRVGGDEFMMILSGSDLEMSRRIIERIDQRIDEYNLKSGEAFELSISLGIVQFDQKKHRSAEELVKAADDVMYREKERYKKLRRELKIG